MAKKLLSGSRHARPSFVLDLFRGMRMMEVSTETPADKTGFSNTGQTLADIR
ncbi:hypothetical protein [Elongatibacter sediminis]|uniref:Uncharacterized protein n=1 Tax=Elongatibacter sediminis TaxID=3119006 RepID=A0AAW9RNF3_9GAMM